jgi:CheY-like chemotaxis protein
VGPPGVRAPGVAAQPRAVTEAPVRVLALVPDLLFGSKVKALLEAAGNDVELAAGETDVWDQVAGTDVLVVDLNADDVDGPGLLDTLRTGGEGHGMRTLGIYAHTDVDLRRRAEEAGYDLVVPRSRMVREGAELVRRLSSPGA